MNVTSETNEIVIPVSMSVDTDLFIDNDGFFYLTIHVYQDEDDSQEVKLPFGTLIENLLSFYKEEYGVDGYQDLYSIAHELTRQAEKLRESASNMEDSINNIGDLFDTKK